ncbi:hypothetical protein HDU96_011027 [Phlyctochytrium bullatum]|nr:hypothetical protein HDU96_011027 [Phlyctochytrium bullatum]
MVWASSLSNLVKRGNLSSHLRSPLTLLNGLTTPTTTSALAASSNVASSTPGNTPPPAAMSSKAKQLVNSILHGSPSTRGEDHEEEASHSKLLARGKYVHKLQSSGLTLSSIKNSAENSSEQYKRIHENPEFKVRLYGSFKTEIGPLDQALHIWEYNKYEGYDETTMLLAKDAKYQKFLKDLRPMLRSRESQIMLEFAFWEASTPSFQDGIYELRTYRLKPGRMLEWEHECFGLIQTFTFGKRREKLLGK